MEILEAGLVGFVLGVVVVLGAAIYVDNCVRRSEEDLVDHSDAGNGYGNPFPPKRGTIEGGDDW